MNKRHVKHTKPVDSMQVHSALVQGFPKVALPVIASEAKQSPTAIWRLLRRKKRASQ